MMKILTRILGILALLALVAAGCGDDSGDDGTSAGADDSSAADDGSSDDSSADDSSADDSSGDDSGSTDGSGGGGTGGTVVLGDETITLDSARCFLQEQDAAAGGGKILFNAQGYGTNAAGDELVVDLTRWDEDSQFTGDDIIVDIGDPFSDDAVSYSATGEIGMITVDGSNLSTGEILFTNFDPFEELPGSVQLSC
ncbi:MAG: hypothetical protein R8F63_05590 [Acidimicrobiales bacterium]|nr:hypothetical protein [Acidimicrobiales bacterium]